MGCMIDELFYQEKEIGEMRQAAFMVERGIFKEEEQEQKKEVGGYYDRRDRNNIRNNSSTSSSVRRSGHLTNMIHRRRRGCQPQRLQTSSYGTGFALAA